LVVYLYIFVVAQFDAYGFLLFIIAWW